MTFAGIIETPTTITFDGYSNKKTLLGAIKEMGRLVKTMNEEEGQSIIDYGKEALLQAKYSYGGYFLEAEEVPCAAQFNEEKDECEYADGRWYIVCRIVK